MLLQYLDGAVIKGLRGLVVVVGSTSQSVITIIMTQTSEITLSTLEKANK